MSWVNSVVGAGGEGVQSHHQNFWFVKILGKISRNVGTNFDIFNIINEIIFRFY